MGYLIPVRGCLSVANGCPCAVPNLRRRFISNGMPNIVVPDVQPHTGLWGTVGHVLVLQIWKP